MRTSIFLLFVFISSLVLAQNNGSATECMAGFKYELNTSVMSVVPATAINFYDASTGDATEWHWDFGDESTSTEQNPLHVYVLPFYNDSMKVKINPYRTVTLRTATSNGCSSEYSETINIYDPVPIDYNTCRAGFKYYLLSYDSLAQTATVQLNNYSEGESLTYSWWFDNGETSTEAEPQVTFDLSQRERKVCLTVSGANGCADTFCDPVYITDPSDIDPVFPPDTMHADCFVSFMYEINYDVQTFAPALTLNFYSKPDGEVEKYLWDFGDGNTSNEANPVHSYNYPTVEDSILGDPNPFRTVCLTITTSTGCESSWCEVINIYMNDETNEECGAWFKYYTPDDLVTIPEIVPLKFFATNDNIVSWSWYFQDGSVSYEPEPLVFFDVFSGSQEVCLTIVTADSCISKWCETVYFATDITDTVYTDPYCGYSFSYQSSYPVTASACVGTVVAQVVLGDSLIDTEYYYWLLPDGTMVDGPELNNLCPTQTYMVTALTTNGCKFSESVVFNSDGTVTVVPINWWIDGNGPESYIRYEVPDSSYTVEWVLCDGSVVSGSDVLLSEIDCGTDDVNLILKDSAGNVVYTQKVGNRTNVPGVVKEGMVLYPNPVRNVLNLKVGQMRGEPSDYAIINVNGMLVQQGLLKNETDGTTQTIDVSSLGKGIYFVRVYLKGNNFVSHRFVK